MSLAAAVIVLISAFMHAGWNILVREQGAGQMFLRLSAVVALIGLPPVLVDEFLLGNNLLGTSWPYAATSAVFLSVYYLGLTRGYSSGDFSMVYPAARGLPVLLVGLGDLIRGHPPGPVGWLGLVIVSGGCLLLPHNSWHTIRWSHYRNWTSLWVVVAALATTGYTIVDSNALQALPTGLKSAIEYNVLETSLAAVFFFLILVGLREPVSIPRGWRSWKYPAIAAVFVFGGYSLVLWAYQLASNASYVLALRQFSIVVGVAAGSFFFSERALALRTTAALIIIIGVACIAFAR